MRGIITVELKIMYWDNMVFSDDIAIFGSWSRKFFDFCHVYTVRIDAARFAEFREFARDAKLRFRIIE